MLIFNAIFFPIYKNVGWILSKTQRKVSKKSSCKRYQDLPEEEKDKEHLYARQWYRILSDEKKNKKWKNGRERDKHLHKDEKQGLVE